MVFSAEEFSYFENDTVAIFKYNIFYLYYVYLTIL